MRKLYIKGPEGQVVPAPRGQTVTRLVDGVPVTTVNPDALKPGWAVATEADADAAALASADAEAEREAAEQEAKDAPARELAARVAALLANKAAPAAKAPADEKEV